MTPVWRASAGPAVFALVLGPVLAPAQHPPAPSRPPRPAPSADPHAQQGTPKGWRFTWPTSDFARGRAAFVKVECYACHEVMETV